MKKTTLFVLIIISLLLMSGCALRGDAADLYKQERPLQVEVNVPESLSAGGQATMEVTLRQDGELVEQANVVHFEISKQDGSIAYPMEEAVEAGNGVYGLPVQFESDGLYTLEVHAENNGSVVNPQHQFIVGELSDSELESLKQGPAPQKEGDGEHH